MGLGTGVDEASGAGSGQGADRAARLVSKLEERWSKEAYSALVIAMVPRVAAQTIRFAPLGKSKQTETVRGACRDKRISDTSKNFDDHCQDQAAAFRIPHFGSRRLDVGAIKEIAHFRKLSHIFATENQMMAGRGWLNSLIAR